MTHLAQAHPAAPPAVSTPTHNPAASAVAHFFREIVAAADQLSGGADLSARQAGVLSAAVEAPGACTVRGLAAHLNVSKPAVTRALDRLEEQRLVKRKPDPRDKRSVLVDPTPKGTAWVAFAARTMGRD